MASNRSEQSKTTVKPKKTSQISRLSPWLTPLAYWLGLYVVFPLYFGRVQVTGQDRLPRQGPVILAPVHKARWDALLVPYAAGRAVTGRDLRFMVSANEVRGIQGWFIRRLGGFAIDPSRPGISSLRHGVDLLEQGEMMVIFPEGGIFRDKQVHTLKPGLARLALQAQAAKTDLGVKIVPIAIEYDRPHVPWRCNVTVRIGDPIDVETYRTGTTKQDAKQLTGDLRSTLDDLIDAEVPEESESYSLPMATASKS